MLEHLCPIRNSNLQERDLSWDLSDVAVCSLDQVGSEYRITVEAFYRISTLLPPSRSRLASWVLKQHVEGYKSPLITTDVLKSLGFGRY